MKPHKSKPRHTKKALEMTGEVILQQLDNVGYHLLKMGITDKVNRHNCIAFLMTEDQRIKGEIERLQFKVDCQKAKIRQTKRTVSSILDHLTEVTPSPLEKPIKGIRSRIGI